MEILNWSALSAEAKMASLRRPAIDSSNAIDVAASIIEQVKQRGDDSLIELATQFDGADLADVLVSREELAAGASQVPRSVQNAIDLAIANVRKFHQAQQTQALRIETAPGVVCERLTRPIDAVGLYVPAGSAPLPSAAIMLGVPALIAGCPEIVMASPPREDGTLDPTVLAVAKRLGISTIVKAGGAQSIAALAYGTKSVPRCCKLFGPGNTYVTAAKILVASDPDGAAIDMPAGPSELMVLADAGANPKFIAADLLSQAEHGPDSQVILVATDQATAAATVDEVQAQCLTLERSEIATRALEGSRCIVVKSRTEAIEIANAYAPEHLIIQMQQARSALPAIRNAGSVFLGPWTPESVGDYCSGTNHVLPTYGFARAYSGLGLNDFCRQMTVQELSAEGLRNIGPATITLADAEGLGAHARAVQFRLASMSDASTKA